MDTVWISIVVCLLGSTLDSALANDGCLSDYHRCSGTDYCCPNGYVCTGTTTCLGVGAIVGIVIAVLVIIAVVVGIVIYCVRKSRS